MERHEFDDGTVLSLQQPAIAGAADAALAVLFDGRPMIGEGIPQALLALQDDATIPPLTLVCVESIEGSTPRGPSRVASLTDPTILGRFMQSLPDFLEHRVAVGLEPSRRLVLGHSLGGNAALYVACHWPHLFGAAVTGSAALYWPGDNEQLAGESVVDDVLASSGLRFWMQAGSNEDAELLAANRDLWERADDAGLDLVHREFEGGHELSAWTAGLALALPHLLSGSALN
jgi:enterochelin esterase family protein